MIPGEFPIHWMIVVPTSFGYVCFVSSLQDRLEALKQAKRLALEYKIERYDIRRAVIVPFAQTQAWAWN